MKIYYIEIDDNININEFNCLTYNLTAFRIVKKDLKIYNIEPEIIVVDGFCK